LRTTTLATELATQKSLFQVFLPQKFWNCSRN